MSGYRRGFPPGGALAPGNVLPRVLSMIMNLRRICRIFGLSARTLAPYRQEGPRYDDQVERGPACGARALYFCCALPVLESCGAIGACGATGVSLTVTLSGISIDGISLLVVFIVTLLCTLIASVGVI